jgi:hypothetical protein
VSEREFRFSATFRTPTGDMYTVRADTVGEMNAQYGEIIDWITSIGPSLERAQWPQEAQHATPDEGDDIIPTAIEKVGEKVKAKCTDCGQYHEFYVKQSGKDGSYFLSWGNRERGYHNYKGPMKWVVA